MVYLKKCGIVRCDCYGAINVNMYIIQGWYANFPRENHCFLSGFETHSPESANNFYIIFALSIGDQISRHRPEGMKTGELKLRFFDFSSPTPDW